MRTYSAPACPSSHKARTATAAMSRSWIGAVGAATWGQRTTSPARICGAHQDRAFAANIPGRRNVHWRPEVSISRSISACSAATGLGCWKKGCAVLCGDERNTMRRVCLTIRSRAGVTAARGAHHTRKTASMPSRHSSRVSARVRSPRTTSTRGGKPAVCGLRASARTRTPVAGN